MLLCDNEKWAPTHSQRHTPLTNENYFGLFPLFLPSENWAVLALLTFGIVLYCKSCFVQLFGLAFLYDFHFTVRGRALRKNLNFTLFFCLVSASNLVERNTKKLSNHSEFHEFFSSPLSVHFSFPPSHQRMKTFFFPFPHCWRDFWLNFIFRRSFFATLFSCLLFSLISI